ncbi:MAG: hypothetical protein AAF221_12170, partial [Pseudomonadota bacterium]
MFLKSALLGGAMAVAVAAGASAMPTANVSGVIVPENTLGAATGNISVSFNGGFDTNAPDLSTVTIFGEATTIGFNDGNNQISTSTFFTDAGGSALNPQSVELTYELIITGLS